MAILVTGGAGYIGSHVVRTLLAAGERAVVVDDHSTGSASSLPDDVPLIVGNFGDSETMSSVLKANDVRAIVHCAASISTAESIQMPFRYYQNNVLNTMSLIESARRTGIDKIVFSSSAAVYGQSLPAPVAEDAPKQPLSPYGWSKLTCERVLADAAAAQGLRYVALRYFNVAGADPSSPHLSAVVTPIHLIDVACQVASGRRSTLEVFGTDYETSDGSCVRDYVHVLDVAAAQVSALRYLNSGGDPVVLNCGTGIGTSVLEVVRAAKRVSGRDFPVTLRDRRLGDPSFLVATADRIRSVLGWRPAFTSLDDIVAHALLQEQSAG